MSGHNGIDKPALTNRDGELILAKFQGASGQSFYGGTYTAAGAGQINPTQLLQGGVSFQPGATGPYFLPFTAATWKAAVQTLFPDRDNYCITTVVTNDSGVPINIDFTGSGITLCAIPAGNILTVPSCSAFQLMICRHDVGGVPTYSAIPMGYLPPTAIVVDNLQQAFDESIADLHLSKIITYPNSGTIGSMTVSGIDGSTSGLIFGVYSQSAAGNLAAPTRPIWRLELNPIVGVGYGNIYGFNASGVGAVQNTIAIAGDDNNMTTNAFAGQVWDPVPGQNRFFDSSAAPTIDNATGSYSSKRTDATQNGFVMLKEYLGSVKFLPTIPSVGYDKTMSNFHHYLTLEGVTNMALLATPYTLNGQYFNCLPSSNLKIIWRIFGQCEVQFAGGRRNCFGGTIETVVGLDAAGAVLVGTGSQTTQNLNLSLTTATFTIIGVGPNSIGIQATAAGAIPGNVYFISEVEIQVLRTGL